MKQDIFQRLRTGKNHPQLICFPYLGGYAASYHKLSTILNTDTDVWSLNLPGHGVSNQKSLETIDEVLDVCIQSLQPLVKDNYIFLGHSMGGIIAYFLTQKILNAEKFPIKPKALILSACNTPNEFSNKNYSNLMDADLLTQIINYDGIPEEIIQERSLLEYFLPIFRSDLKILESSSLCKFSPLDIPIYYLWGEADKIVSIDSVTNWSKYFSQAIKLVPIPDGTHLFIQKKVEAVAQKLDEIITQIRVSD